MHSATGHPTDRHELERELRDLGGRLIAAHEQERIRISRELHDGIAQRVSFLSAELGILQRQLASAPQDVQDQMTQLSNAMADVGSELHRLSHELHPAPLEQLGLEAALRSFCNELARRGRIAFHLECADVPSELPTDVALCLYRITQEALHNVVKHSGAAHAHVALTGGRNGIVLRVTDDGAGFDPREASQKGTLGLVSIRERARHVRAQLVLSSNPGEGTLIEVRVPAG